MSAQSVAYQYTLDPFGEKGGYSRFLATIGKPGFHKSPMFLV